MTHEGGDFCAQNAASLVAYDTGQEDGIEVLVSVQAGIFGTGFKPLVRDHGLAIDLDGIELVIGVEHITAGIISHTCRIKGRADKLDKPFLDGIIGDRACSGIMIVFICSGDDTHRFLVFQANSRRH